MVEFFGEIGPALLVAIISGVVQFIKDKTGWQDGQVDAFAIILNYLVFTPYTVIAAFRANPSISGWDTAWVGFMALIYPLIAWLLGAGYYYKIIKPAEKRLQRPPVE